MEEMLCLQQKAEKGRAGAENRDIGSSDHQAIGK
jgi:hypothetical protein